MKARTILIIAGAVVAAKLMATRHHHDSAPGHQHGHGPGRGCHGTHGAHAFLHQPEWRGLTEDEARAKLADRLGGDQTAIDEAIAYLEEHGYLARVDEPVES